MLTVLNVALLEVCFFAVPHPDGLATQDYPVLELPAAVSALTWLTAIPVFVSPAMSGITSPVKKIYSVVSNKQGQLAQHSKEHSFEVKRMPSEYT